VAEPMRILAPWCRLVTPGVVEARDAVDDGRSVRVMRWPAGTTGGSLERWPAPRGQLELILDLVSYWRRAGRSRQRSPAARTAPSRSTQGGTQALAARRSRRIRSPRRVIATSRATVSPGGIRPTFIRRLAHEVKVAAPSSSEGGRTVGGVSSAQPLDLDDGELTAVPAP